MSEPETEAGRRLLQDGGRHGIVPADILAIEQEARADLVTAIVAAVEAVPVAKVAMDYRADVLRAIREASE